MTAIQRASMAFFTAAALSSAALCGIASAQDGKDRPASQAARIVVVSGPGWKASESAGEGWVLEKFDDSRWAEAQTSFSGNPGESFPQLAPSNCFAFESTAEWIWGSYSNRVFLRKRFSVEMDVHQAVLAVTADNEASIWVNGILLGTASSDTDLWGGRGVARAFDVAPYIFEGVNIIAIDARDRGGCMGVCADLRIDGPPFAETLRSIVPGVPPENITPRWRPAFTLREYTAAFLSDLYSSPNKQRNAVMHLRGLALLSDRSDSAAALLSAALLGGAPAERADAAECIALLNMKQLFPLVIDAFAGTADSDARLKLAVYAAGFAEKQDIALLEKALEAYGRGKQMNFQYASEILESSDPITRAEGMKKLKEAGEAALPALREVASKGSPAARARAAALLAALGNDPSAPLRYLSIEKLSAAVARIKSGK